MAYAKQRRENGTPTGRWTAVYVDNSGKERSAGTFDNEAKALATAERQEEFIRTGKQGVDPKARATMTIDEYFPRWLENLQIERSTRGGYRRNYRYYVEKRFGGVRVAELEREAVRALLADLRERGLGPAVQKQVRSLISGIMRDAIEDGYRTDNPASNLKISKRRGGTRKIKVLTVEQFQAMLDELPTEGARLLARLIISTGCRPSEAFVLTVDDLTPKASGGGKVEFNKALQVLDKEDAVDGETLVVGPLKTHDIRELDLNPSLMRLLWDWIAANGLTGSDLIFHRHDVFPRLRATSVRKDPIILTPELIATLGTVVAPNGREYQHGKWNAYITAKCKCAYCRQAFSDYRYEREQITGKTGHARSHGAIASARTSPFITPDIWRARFQAAVKAAEIPFVPTAYQLRHTHASWLIASGVDPKKVMTRLGHTSLKTTNIYVHDVGDDEVSADVMEDLLDW